MFNNNLNMNKELIISVYKELIISVYKELIDSNANRDWSISELRAFSQTVAELIEQFEKMDNI